MIFFFSGSLKFIRAQNSRFHFDFLKKFQCSSFAEMKANTIEQQKWKSHVKHDRLLVSKVEFKNRISQRNFG